MSALEEKKFLELLKKHQNIIHKICTLYAKDDHEHKDLFQEIAIQLWKVYPSFRGDSKFSTWMYRVSLNTAIGIQRKEKNKPNTDSIDELKIAKTEAQDFPSEDEKSDVLYRALSHLNKMEKALVFLYLEGKNYKEISETLNITEVNARVKMNRIKTKLQEQINKNPNL